MEELINVKKTKIAMLQIRGQKVIVDKDLAELYGVRLNVLRTYVKKNFARFPYDFMLRLMNDEIEYLMSDNTVNPRRLPHKDFPYVFTERGASMLACLLNSERAIILNLQIIRAFVE